jgi:hypothetical protein
MWRIIRNSLLLAAASLVICCVLYPVALWAVGQTVFPFEANGSLLKGSDGQIVGSRLIAQPFTKDATSSPGLRRLGTTPRPPLRRPWPRPTMPCATGWPG